MPGIGTGAKHFLMTLTNKALWVIERNLDRPLTLGEIADACGVSSYHLAHAFDASTGTSP